VEEPAADWLTDTFTRVINDGVALLAEESEPGKTD
jgi:hypothetical protein